MQSFFLCILPSEIRSTHTDKSNAKTVLLFIIDYKDQKLNKFVCMQI